MTSEERHELRFQRRKAKREEKKSDIRNKTFDDVFSFGNLCAAGESCCKGVRWKASTINFETNLLSEAQRLYTVLHEDKYKFIGFRHFKTVEHGKEREIDALNIRDRAVQKCLCDNIMTEAYSRSFIYDNSASLPNRGMDFALRRLRRHLHYHYRLHGLEGGIYQFDFKGYFASIPHQKAKENAARYIKDPRILKLLDQLIDDFQELEGIPLDLENPHGVGLGSQVSQNIALEFANPIDHYAKDVLGIKCYARYMDDGYVISDSMEFLYQVKDAFYKIAEEQGIQMSDKKNVIIPFKNHSFKFLKMRLRLEESGKITFKLSRQSIKAMRRKLQVFRKWVSEDKMSAEDAFSSYQSWRAHARRCDSYYTLRNMDEYFVRLFADELAKRKKKFPCTLKAVKVPEYGWKYERYHSKN